MTHALSSVLTELDPLGYETLNRPHADVLDVNQSPPARRFTRGTKYCSRSWGEWRGAICLRDSTALSLTTVSSTVAKLSRGTCSNRLST